ncbi:hypothetical protein GQ600_7367 [Phytophthora cactorum]|nr:hypothetical protein GQ600_7367 [Phytophthora cactorum]
MSATDVSYFWSWIEDLTERQPILAGGSLYCTDLEGIANGSADSFSTSPSSDYSVELMDPANAVAGGSIWLALDCSAPHGRRLARGWQSSGLNAGGAGKGKARGKGKGPQFTRVIPKFLQKYHQPPAIQAKFATLPSLERRRTKDWTRCSRQQSTSIWHRRRRRRRREIRRRGVRWREEGEENDKDLKKKSGQTVVQMGKGKGTASNGTKRRSGNVQINQHSATKSCCRSRWTMNEAAMKLCSGSSDSSTSSALVRLNAMKNYHQHQSRRICVVDVQESEACARKTTWTVPAAVNFCRPDRYLAPKSFALRLFSINMIGDFNHPSVFTVNNYFSHPILARRALHKYNGHEQR